MWFFSKKEIKNSEEYEKVIKRITEINSALELLKTRLEALDVKMEAYRNEIKNVKKKAKEIVEELQEEEQESESNKYADGFDSLRGII